MPTAILPSGLKLSYADRGDVRDPAVLLIPGPSDSWRSYQPVLDLLPQEICAVSVSQRGHGESDKPAKEYAIADFAADIVAFLDGLEVERAFLAGHSGSCLIARRIALDHPDRVAGLILEASPTTLRDHPKALDFVESVVSGLEDPISPDFARSFVVGTSSPSIDPAALELLVDDVLKVPAHVWRQMFTVLLQYDDVAELGGIGAPTLLVWGDTDTLVSRDMQEQLLRSIPDAHLLVYAGIGHTPRWDDPVRFSNDLVAFVHRVRSRPG